MSITFIGHAIKNASYSGERKSSPVESLPVNITGEISVSRNSDPGVIFVDYHFILGEEDKPILTVDTRTSFRYLSDGELTDEKVKEVCLPEAQRRMQDDVNRLLKDYGEEGIRVPDLVEA